MYKVLSWDVGIKNLAYCILEKKDADYNVCQWDIVDIIDSRIKDKCCIDKCNNDAKFSCVIDNVTYYYCGVHKAKCKTLEDNWEDKFIIKEKSSICCTYDGCKKTSSFKTNEKEVKKEKFLCTNHKNSYLNKIKKNSNLVKLKNSTCDDFTPLEVSKKMYEKLDKIPELLQVNEVIIENQPSLINPKIKAVGSFLYSYFVMRGIIDKKNNSTITKVSFTSPSNKLKINNDKTVEILTKTESGEKYKLTKKLGIEYTRIILQSEKKWITHLDSYKKKDDLCDALLQGYHYMYSKIDKRKNN